MLYYNALFLEKTTFCVNLVILSDPAQSLLTR